MNKNKNDLSNDTVIGSIKSISLRKYHDFFIEATGMEFPGAEFFPWLNTQNGKTIKEAIADYHAVSQRKSIENRLLEERFDFISDDDKAFIIAFDKEIEKLGYDHGGGIGDGYCWGKYMIVYNKTGVKSQKVIARIFINDNEIILKLFFTNIDKHSTYIECAPEYIKEVFIGTHGNCGCNPKKENCKSRKTYTIDGKQIQKCSGVVFEFHKPDMDKLHDYINLLAEFYPVKKA